MEIPDFINQLAKLRERELEQKVWEMWLAKFPYMTEESSVTYADMLAIAKQQTEEDEEPGVYVNQILF